VEDTIVLDTPSDKMADDGITVTEAGSGADPVGEDFSPGT